MGIHIGLGLNSRRAGAAVPQIITATVPPSLSALTDAQTPSAGYTAGTYTSTAGTIASAVPTYLVNGAPQPGSYDLSAGDTVQVSVLVTDSASNTRVFLTGTVTVATATAPVISGASYDGGTDTLTMTVSEPVTLYALHNASATPLTAAAIEAAAEVTQVLAAGDGFIDWNDDTWGSGTFYLHVAVKDAGGLTDTIAPIEHIRPVPGFYDDWAAYALGNTFTEIGANYTRNGGQLLATIVADAAAPAGKACAIETTTANERYMMRNVVTAALALRTTERIQYRGLVRTATGLNNARAVIGYVRDVGNLHTGITITRGSTTTSGAVGCQLEGNPSSLSNNINILTGLSDGALVRVLCEIDGLDVKVKAWLDGDPEPGSWTTQTHTGAISFPEMSLMARVVGVNMHVLAHTLAIGADAPAI